MSDEVQKPARKRSAKPKPAPEVPVADEAPENKILDGVFVLIERGVDGEISALRTIANGDVRRTEVGDILRNAIVQHDRQIKG